MNNFIRTFLCALAVMVVLPLRADDSTDGASTPSVSARMDCKAIKAKIDELTQNGASDELSRLQLQYRKDCVVRASVARASHRGGMSTVVATGDSSVNVPANANVAPTTTTNNENASVKISDAQQEMCARLPDEIANATTDAKDVFQLTYDEYCAKNVVAPVALVKTTMLVLGPMETPEQEYARIAENLDAGLCPDGNAPNRFGCCGDEVFKDLGNLEFACCPPTGECFPPIK